jgi:SH3-like domain-containing protein
MVQPGIRVRQGHMLGLVGNTGNAKTTPPHLHFGIYQQGSKDPLYYIHTIEEAMKSLPIDTGFHQKPFKVRSKMVNLMAGPSAKMKIKSKLNKNTYLTVIGQSHDWYRISLPDFTEGFILKDQLEPLRAGTISKLDSAQVLLSEIRADAVPVARLDKNSSVEVLATFQNFSFVKTENGIAGWLYN